MELARRFDLIPAGRHDILWVVEFPAFFWDPRNSVGRGASSVHRPTGRSRRSRRSCCSRAYDLVLDGAEIGGGSIRIHQRDIQQRVFELLGIGPDEAQARFGFLLDALALRRAAARRDRHGTRPDRRGAGRAARTSAR